MQTHKQPSPISNELLEKVATSLARASTCIKDSSKQLREAYSVNESLMTVDTITYRRVLYSECSMYSAKVFPRTVSLVENVKDMLESYVYDTEDDFVKDIDGLRDECLVYAKEARFVQKGHVFVLGNLKALENEMRQKVGLLYTGAVDSRNNAAVLRSQGSILKVIGGLGLAVGPCVAGFDGGMITIIGTIAASVAIAKGEIQNAKAAKTEYNATVAVHNATILHSLIHSLQEFSEAVDLVAKFVTLTEIELRQIAGSGVGRELKARHYRKIKGKAKDLIESCRCFLGVRPAIESDLMSIRESLENGYEEQWERRSKAFQNSSSGPRIEDLDTAIVRRPKS